MLKTISKTSLINKKKNIFFLNKKKEFLVAFLYKLLFIEIEMVLFFFFFQYRLWILYINLVDLYFFIFLIFFISSFNIGLIKN